MARVQATIFIRCWEVEPWFIIFTVRTVTVWDITSVIDDIPGEYEKSTPHAREEGWRYQGEENHPVPWSQVTHTGKNGVIVQSHCYLRITHSVSMTCCTVHFRDNELTSKQNIKTIQFATDLLCTDWVLYRYLLLSTTDGEYFLTEMLSATRISKQCNCAGELSSLNSL